jgi:nicotinate phosphoribosyltransferase
MSTISFLDFDFYKITMGQFVWKYFPDTVVKYEFKNRTKDVCLGHFVSIDAVNSSISEYQKTKITESEAEYLIGLGHFEKGYIEFLKNITLPTPVVSLGSDGNLNISVTGKWSEAIYWETVILSIVNKLYCDSQEESAGGKEAIEKEGHKRLDEKILMLKKYPGIRFSEFGTRRRRSLEWQEEVIKTLIKEVPEQLIGTSNVHLAMKLGISPIGTQAHELFMTGSRLFGDSDSDIFSAHGKMLDMWYEYYGEKFSVALTDTYGTDFFFQDFGKERAEKWKGLRQDSGDPFTFAAKTVDFYISNGINPKRKSITFSDGLDVNKIVALYNGFSDRIGVGFGWGTDLTNSLGIKPLSLVMKVVKCEGKGLVKLSDNLAKATGKEDDIRRFKIIFGYINDKSEKLIY